MTWTGVGRLSLCYVKVSSKPVVLSWHSFTEGISGAKRCTFAQLYNVSWPAPGFGRGHAFDELIGHDPNFPRLGKGFKQQFVSPISLNLAF